MDEILERIILIRLDEEPDLPDQTRALVIAASRGEEDLVAALAGTAHRLVDEARTGAPVVRQPAYLQKVAVEGFRGIGPRTTLEISPGPGLTLVVGRNGSGKSSFAEALELLITGNNSRWSTRSAIWKEGWRNLHQPETRIEAAFVVEGEKGETVLSREWEPDAKLDDGETVVQVDSETSDLETMGWLGAVETYRPFLSYSELGSMLDAGPSALYDALSSILGLEELVSAEARVKEAIKIARKLEDQATSALAPLLEKLESMDDERAVACAEALSGKVWDLETVEKVVLVSAGGDQEESELAALRQLSLLEAPSSQDVEAAAKSLDEGAAALRKTGGSEAERARKTAGLLEEALVFHSSHGDQDCPVCGRGFLDGSWREKTEKELLRLQSLAEEAELAHKSVEEAIRGAHGLLRSPPAILASISGLGLESEEINRAWKSWSEGLNLNESEPLADHLRSSIEPLTQALGLLRESAGKELERREDVWRPIAADLAAWLDDAKQAQAAREKMDALRGAEKWLRNASADIRNERFAPIADVAQGVWQNLRMQSSVELKKIVLTGTGTARKVVLDVTVDGVDGAALGVMSQGELNSLALSLFMPRATLPESPFRFVVIDDPVQSMDPSRVDGLARVLEQTAQGRQVIVFTHDDRLPRSCRLLGIDAKVIEVTRRANSMVELRTGYDPVSRHVSDAWAIAKSEDLDPAMGARIVGVFCRSAIEAACTEAITRRLLTSGQTYVEIETLLDSAKGLTQLMALALFSDIERTKEVMPALEKGIGKWASSAYRRVQEAAHNPVKADALVPLVQESERLARGLVQLP